MRISIDWTGPARVWPALLATGLFCVRGLADSPVPLPDTAFTVPLQPVVVPVLANDWAADSNGLAIINVSAPAHGTVSFNSSGAPPDAELAGLFAFAAVQLSNSVAQVQDTNAYPKSTLTNGTWKTSPASDWTSGFFAGCLWYLYEQTADPRFRTWAESWTGGLASQQFVTTTTDLGFMLNDSFGAGYRLTHRFSYGLVCQQAARSVVQGGYNPAVGMVGQVWPGNTLVVAIDWMMNMELLFRTSAMNGDRTLYTNAYTTADRMLTDSLRPDGSGFQLITYNASTGALLHKGRYDGVSDNSTWARGQAWGVYGFAMINRETGNPRFLWGSQRMAEWFLTNVPPDLVPYWDFNDPAIPNAPRDSSASAILLCGLLQLSQQATNATERARYWRAARQVFDSLRSTNYLAQGSSSRGLLLHGTGNAPQDSDPEVDCSLIQGDYYFIESLRRYTELYRRTSITYTPAAGFQGTDTFTYQVGNRAGDCASATVTVQVNPAFTNAFAARISGASTGQPCAVDFPSVPARSYFVQYVTNLPRAGAWSLLASNLAGSGGILAVSDTNSGGQRYYRVGLQPAPVAPPPPLALLAATGALTSPFALYDGCLYQTVETGLAAGGRAAWSFVITNAGNYSLQAIVDAPHGGANSFFVNIDAEPTDPYMIWDIDLTTGLEQRAASWRGNGTFDHNEFVPKIFSLTAGPHQLIIRGREANTALQRVTLQREP